MRDPFCRGILVRGPDASAAELMRGFALERAVSGDAGARCMAAT